MPHKSCLELIAPKKFCCRYELQIGCKFVGILLAVIMAACTIDTAIQSIDLTECTGCPRKSWKHAYGYSVSTSVYCALMCLMNFWYVWAVAKEKKSVVLTWVVVSAVWLTQTACLLIVLIIKYDEEVGDVTWAVSFACCILVILILAYFVFAGYGYFLQLRDRQLASMPKSSTRLKI